GRRGPNWLFDIDALTKSMNFKPVVAGNQSNGNAGTKECDDSGKASVETVPGQDYILLPLWTQALSFSSSEKVSLDDGFKPSREKEKKDDEDLGNECVNPSEGQNGKVLSTEEPKVNQEKENDVNSINSINTVSSTFNAANLMDNAANNNEASHFDVPDDPNMPKLEDDSILEYNNSMFDEDEDVGAKADMTNLDTHISVSPILTTRLQKDHPLTQIIGDIMSP
ncbi:hypothetical protein Tco_1330454, partial [Tanacetum coccineum]